MLKNLIKQAILSLHPLAAKVYEKRQSSVPFLCIVTPIFDPALPSLKGLIKDLQKQSFPEFKHVLISNGLSPKCKAYLETVHKTDPRFIYVQLKAEVQDSEHLVANIGKRKNYGMKHFEAERYVFIDADSKIIDPDFVAKLYMSHIVFRKDILVVQIKMGDIILPRFPLYLGHIDLTNYTFSRKIALNSKYPTKPGLLYALSTDYAYFREINTATNTIFLPFTYLIKDARKSYKSIRKTVSGSRA